MSQTLAIPSYVIEGAARQRDFRDRFRVERLVDEEDDRPLFSITRRSAAPLSEEDLSLIAEFYVVIQTISDSRVVVTELSEDDEA